MILVTGASGHLGNVLVRELLSEGKSVRAMVLPGENGASLGDLSVEIVEGNVLDPESLDHALVGVDRVFHLAGIISIIPGAENIMQKVNIEGVRNVVNAAMRAGVKRLVHTSSIHAFKRLPHGVIVDETAPLSPDSPVGAYDRTKAEGTLVVLDAVLQGLDAVIVCPTGVIGPHDFMKSELGQTILSFTRKGLQLIVEGAYDFVDVRDVARGLILAMEKGRKGEIYILSGEQVKVRELYQITQTVAGVRSPELIIPSGMARVFAKIAQQWYRITRTTPRFTTYALQTLTDNSKFSHAKAQRELGYRPRPLRESVADIVAWWKQIMLSPVALRTKG